MVNLDPGSEVILRRWRLGDTPSEATPPRAEPRPGPLGVYLVAIGRWTAGRRGSLVEAYCAGRRHVSQTPPYLAGTRRTGAGLRDSSVALDLETRWGRGSVRDSPELLSMARILRIEQAEGEEEANRVVHDILQTSLPSSSATEVSSQP